MIITIQGDRGSGKSTIANKIAGGGVAFYTSGVGIEHVFWNNDMKPTTQYIIVEETNRNYGKLKRFFNKKMLNIVRRNGQELKIVMPIIILIKQ